MNIQDEVTICDNEVVFHPGEVIWVKLPRDFWWPGVVISKNAAKSSGKKFDKLKNVTVRLYGGNKRIKVSEEQCSMEMQDFRKNNSNHSKLLINGMKQHVISKVSGKSKKKKQQKDETGEGISEIKKEDKKGKKMKDENVEVKRECKNENAEGTKENKNDLKKGKKRKDEYEKSKSGSKKESSGMKMGSKDEIAKKSKKVKIDELLKQENGRKTKKQRVVEDECKDVTVSRTVKIMRYLGLCPPLGSPFSYVL